MKNQKYEPQRHNFSDYSGNFTGCRLSALASGQISHNPSPSPNTGGNTGSHSHSSTRSNQFCHRYYVRNTKDHAKGKPNREQDFDHFRGNREIVKVNMGKVEKLIIVGSGPAGLTAAIYAARGGLDPLVIMGEMPGGHPTIATVIDDYPGFPEGVDAPKLAKLFERQAKRFNTRFKNGKVEKVDFSGKPFKLFVGGEILEAQAVILALGSAPKWLGLPSEKKLIGRGVSVCATCDGPFFKNKKVIVVGGGDSALKEAYYLAKIAKSVTVIHRREEFRAQEALQTQVKALPNVQFVLNSEVLEILGEGKVTGVKIKNNQSGGISEMEVDGVFIAVGYRPETEFLKGQIELDPTGHIVLKDETQTSVPGIFAAGDVTDIKYKQVVVACGSGAKAALDTEKYLDNLNI